MVSPGCYLQRIRCRTVYVWYEMVIFRAIRRRSPTHFAHYRRAMTARLVRSSLKESLWGGLWWAQFGEWMLLSVGVLTVRLEKSKPSYMHSQSAERQDFKNLALHKNTDQKTDIPRKTWAEHTFGFPLVNRGLQAAPKKPASRQLYRDSY